MKILFIISNLGSGGAERVLVTIANALVKKHDVMIVKFDKKKPFYNVDKRIVLEDLNVKNLKIKILEKGFKTIKLIYLLRKKINYYDPDIVISFMDITNIYSIFAAKLVNRKIIISERINYTYLKSTFWRFLRSITYPYSDGMVVLSKFDYDKYTKVRNKKVIFNPLFLSKTFSLNDKKENIILSVGRLVDDKGFDTLLLALSLVERSLFENWKVYIVGDGPQKQKLENLSKKLMLNSVVKFLGRKKNIDEYYKKASIFISTSRAEGFPNALSEALSLGCASIATDCLTGPSELIENNKNGFLVKVDDVNSIKQKLETLMINEKIRVSFSLESRKRSFNFNTDVIVKEWENYIKEIISK